MKGRIEFGVRALVARMAGVESPATYDCTCRTCRDETTREGYDAAHEFFVDHADLGHHVEIARHD